MVSTPAQLLPWEQGIDGAEREAGLVREPLKRPLPCVGAPQLSPIAFQGV